jgi:alkyl hydroperoxide reductase subunit AhpC
MSLLLGDVVPDFNAKTSRGDLDFHAWLSGQWCVFFSHPADFTPVCTTELGEVACLRKEFDRRQVRVLALSVDSVASHIEWIRDIEEIYQCEVFFPIIADEALNISRLFGFVHPNASDVFTVRSVVIIGPDKKVKLLLTYPASTGRNFTELLRVLDSLQLNAQHGLLTPANWQEGEPVIVSPAIKTEDIPLDLKQELEVIKPYFRKVRRPK